MALQLDANCDHAAAKVGRNACVIRTSKHVHGGTIGVSDGDTAVAGEEARFLEMRRNGRTNGV